MQGIVSVFLSLQTGNLLEKAQQIERKVSSETVCKTGLLFEFFSSLTSVNSERYT